MHVVLGLHNQPSLCGVTIRNKILDYFESVTVYENKSAARVQSSLNMLRNKERMNERKMSGCTLHEDGPLTILICTKEEK